MLVMVCSNTADVYVLVYMQFARLYPLNQLDLPVEKKHVDFGPLLGSGVKVENPSRDYTPPSEYELLQLGLLRAVMATKFDLFTWCCLPPHAALLSACTSPLAVLKSLLLYDAGCTCS